MRKILPPFAAMLAMLAVVMGGARADGAPANDNFEAAKLVPSIPFVETIDTTGATTQPDEPDAFSSCASAGSSVWYSYTPSSAAKLTASLHFSQINAVVGVYTGPSIDNLSLVGCEDEVNFVPVAGETYYFQIGDTVDVHQRILEGQKERVQIFSGHWKAVTMSVADSDESRWPDLATASMRTQSIRSTVA